MNKIYEGKAKTVYETENSQEYLLYFKDDATAFNNKKHDILENKGKLNNRISTFIFQLLEKQGMPSHFIKNISDREMLVKKVKIIPLEVVVRNRIAGSLAKRYGLSEGEELKNTMVEFYYKNDALDDPLMTEDHIYMMRLAANEEIQEIREMALRINKVLKNFFLQKKIHLVDFKIEFGRTEDGRILLADEISPDSCRLWDVTTGEKLDKDRFRRDMGRVTESYEEVFNRMREACV
ncbi:MAG: phosphoribosylaminoimidazolesuccinocarboxamide synthase [Deltaproteobacteria bacterium]|nr:phosphoribosylaminoimidazolesuccinocarboxamide synthase [Deltaproteobacteria bacterium]